jgi:hypothetical protein
VAVAAVRAAGIKLPLPPPAPQGPRERCREPHAQARRAWPGPGAQRLHLRPTQRRAAAEAQLSQAWQPQRRQRRQRSAGACALHRPLHRPLHYRPLHRALRRALHCTQGCRVAGGRSTAVPSTAAPRPTKLSRARSRPALLFVCS